ncbi:MAG: hypothetical protein ACFFFB_23095 [Candidatus Heimdallarchaeota archaeon]
MPHFGFIDKKLPGIEQCLLRARLNIIKGKKKIKNREFSTGIVELYDGFVFSLYWYFLSDKMLKPLLFNRDGSYKDEEILYQLLLLHGRIDGTFDFGTFLGLTVKAINNELKEFKYETLIKAFDSLMVELQVLPYKKKNLAQEQAIFLNEKKKRFINF